TQTTPRFASGPSRFPDTLAKLPKRLRTLPPVAGQTVPFAYFWNRNLVIRWVRNGPSPRNAESSPASPALPAPPLPYLRFRRADPLSSAPEAIAHWNTQDHFQTISTPRIAWSGMNSAAHLPANQKHSERRGPLETTRDIPAAPATRRRRRGGS